MQKFLGTYCIECHGPEKQKGDRRFDQLTLPATKLDTLIDLQDIVDQLNLGDMPPKKSKQPSSVERGHFIAQLGDAITQARTALASTGGRTVLRRLNRREYINTVGDLFAMNMAAFDKNFQQQPELSYSHGRVYNFRYLCVYECMDSENHEGGYAPIAGFQKGVPVDGFYEIKVLAHALNRQHPYDPDIFGTDAREPFHLGIVPGNASIGPLHHPQPQQPILAEQVMRDGEPEWYTMKVWLDAGQTPRFVFPNGMRNCRQAFQRLASRYRDTWPKNDPYQGGIVDARRIVLQHGQMPHIRIHEVGIRGPIIEQWPPATQQAVFGSKPFAPERMREILQSFADRAYRRPATKDEVDRLVAVAEARVRAGHTPFEAMKDGLKAALCSPAFLYLSNETKPVASKDAHPPLEAHALATRLSYFLWSTMPDAELRRLADNGSLLKTDVLLAQAQRMLKDRRCDAFVAGFLDGWLNLRSLGDMPPDRDAFGVYYTKDFQHVFKRETQLFTRDLIDRNGSLLNFINADYTFANRPLARLYGQPDAVPPEKAQEFVRIKFNNPQRGGLLGQGSVLTVSANGVETSPVIRGVWLLENILGTPPQPPPDNVPPIDPDVRGASSMREILTKHRNNPTCFDCHQKIDPLGFALENFDPIGAWRTTYNKRTPIDASGELPGGQKFQDIAGLKQILIERKDQFARMLTERVMAYATGRRMEPLDRPAVTKVMSETAKNDYGLRTLMEQVVLSEAFRSK